MEREPTAATRALTAPRLLARNALWNLVSQLAPMVAAIIFIPFLIRGLGVDGFGVLSLAWMIVGYFSLFDLGLARALTKLVADKLGRGQLAEIPALVWTSLALMLGLGVIGAVLALALAPWAKGALKIPPHLGAETTAAVYLMALTVPAVTTTAALRGVLEANQRFGIVNALKVPLSVFNYAGPAAALLVSRRLDVVVAVLVASRFVALAAHVIVCWKALPEALRPVSFRADHAKPLMSFGGWMTVSNLVSPLMVYFDRFAIGAWVSLAAVSAYVTPYEMITKLWVIPGALVGVLFPAFSTSFATDRLHTARLLDKGMRYVFLATFPVTLTIVTLSHVLLRVWVGEDMAARGAAVLQWLSAGVLVNGLAAVPFALLHGAGRPDLTAKLHLLELPLYAAFLWWAVGRFGIVGAAVAWTARVTLDAVAISWLARQVIDGPWALRWWPGAMGLASALMVAGAHFGSTLAGGAFLAAALVSLAPLAWRFALGDEERALLRGGLRALTKER